MPRAPRRKLKAYDNRKPLECCEFASLQRCLGVLISEEFTHQGLGIQMADCECETITVNTMSYGSVKPVEEVAREKVLMLRRIIKDIDRVISELRGHKQRLLKDIGDW